MTVAKAYQQPRSVILGRVVQAREPLWLPEDLEWALAHEEYLNGFCPGCGTPLAAWEDAKPGEAPFVGVARRRPCCEEKALTEDEIPENERGKGVYVAMVPAAVYDHQQEAMEAADRLGLPWPSPERVG